MNLIAIVPGYHYMVRTYIKYILNTFGMIPILHYFMFGDDPVYERSSLLKKPNPGPASA